MSFVYLLSLSSFSLELEGQEHKVRQEVFF